MYKESKYVCKIKKRPSEALSDETRWLEAASFLGIGLSQAVLIVLCKRLR